MADVRSMLREQRQARRTAHPHASYTSDGKLLCNLCETTVKEAAWQGHLHSTQHTLRQTRAQEAAVSRSENGTAKKRKASTIDSPSPEQKKKSKPTVTFATPVDEHESRDAELKDLTSPADAEVQPTKMSPKKDVQEQEGADAADMEAFERELQEMEASMAKDRTEGVTISAAPMSAEEVAAQAREEQSAQRGKRDAEIEGEREDAARLLEDEFEEMEGLEERVKRLREKREALRKGPEGSSDEQIEQNEENHVAASGDAAGDTDEEDEDDEDYDSWNFGRS